MKLTSNKHTILCTLCLIIQSILEVVNWKLTGFTSFGGLALLKTPNLSQYSSLSFKTTNVFARPIYIESTWSQTLGQIVPRHLLPVIPLWERSFTLLFRFRCLVVGINCTLSFPIQATHFHKSFVLVVPAGVIG